MAKLAFVTGAAGFIGSYTSRVLAEDGWTVGGLGIGFQGNEASLKANGINRWKEDLVTLDSLRALSQEMGVPDAVIHCAGSGSVTLSFQHPQKDFLKNVNTTLDVLEFARQCECIPKIVVPSSAAVYGSVCRMPISESCPQNPISPYGRHKVIMEDVCHSYAENWGIRISVVRLFSIYGEGLRKQLMWDACCKAQKGDFNFFGTGNEIRDWLHVLDAARLMRDAVGFASSQCTVVNGGTGIGISVKNLVERIGLLWTPKRIPSFSGKTKIGDPTHYIADCRKLSRLGFTPSVAFEEGLVEYVTWFKKGGKRE